MKSNYIVAASLSFIGLSSFVPTSGCASSHGNDVALDAPSLVSVPPTVLAAAQAHLASIASDGKVWQHATLSAATPMYRPDLADPSYYELTVVEDGAPSGWMMVAVVDQDERIVTFETSGEAPSAALSREASESGAKIARIYSVTPLVTIAEDARGEPVASVPRASGGFDPAARSSAWKTLKGTYVEKFAARVGRAERARRDPRTLAGGALAPQRLPIGNPKTPPDTNTCVTHSWGWARSESSSDAQPPTPLYNQVKLGDCANGCAGTAFAMVFGWMSQLRHAKTLPLDAWDVPGMENGFQASPRFQSVPIQAPMTMPSEGTEQYDALMNQYGELFNDLGTFCSGSQGSTIPIAISGLGINSGLKSGIDAYVQRHGIPVNFHERFSLISDSDFMDEIIYSLSAWKAPVVVSIETEAPRELENILGVAISKLHYPVVDALAECGFYHVNFGWGGKYNRWLTRGELEATLRYTGRFEPARPGFAARLEKTGTLHIGGKCLDLPNDNSTNGTRVDLYDCTGGPSELWSLYQDGTIRPTFHPDKCLDNPFGSANLGNPVDLYDCTGGPSERWTLAPWGDTHVLMNSNGLCVDDPNFVTTNGTTLDQYTCNGGGSQAFTFVPLR